MASIQLKFQAAAEVNGKEQDGLLLLSDQEQQRQLVITCSRKILKEITERKTSEVRNKEIIERNVSEVREKESEVKPKPRRRLWLIAALLVILAFGAVRIPVG